MSYSGRSSNLNRRTGYPSAERQNHLDIPMADQYQESGVSGGGAGASGGWSSSKARRRGAGGGDSAFMRSLKGASFATKASYVWAIFSLLVGVGAIRSIRATSGAFLL